MIHIEQGMKVVIDDIKFENNWLFDECTLFETPTEGGGDALLMSFNNCTGNVRTI